MKNNKENYCKTINYDGEFKLSYSISVKSVIEDIKYFCKEYYIMRYENVENGIKVYFNNGQAFKISVAEIIV